MLFRSIRPAIATGEVANYTITLTLWYNIKKPQRYSFTALELPHLPALAGAGLPALLQEGVVLLYCTYIFRVELQQGKKNKV